MKKLFVVIAAALVAISASAQVRLEGSLSLGGYNKNSGFNSKVGFNGRVLYDFGIGSSASGEDFMISVGAGLLMNNTSTKGTNSGNFNCNWLQVPVTVGSFYPIGKCNLYAAVGVYYAYAISGKVISNSASLDVIRNEASSLNIIKPHDFGWLAQIGIALPCKLGFYIGYNRGFLNIAAQPDSEARNSIGEVGLLYKF